MTPLLLALACVHTPPHLAPSGEWKKDYTRREETREDGTYCAWEAESLTYKGVPLWSAEPPEGENWCAAADESSRYFDVVGQDGPFLSVRTVETGCCPERSTAACLTWNLETGKVATLADYDEHHAAKRITDATAILADEDYKGFVLADNGWVVKPDGHVALCAVPAAGAHSAADIREIDVK